MGEGEDTVLIAAVEGKCWDSGYESSSCLATLWEGGTATKWGASAGDGDMT